MNYAAGLSKRADAVTNRAHLLEVAQAVFAESGLDLEVNDIASGSASRSMSWNSGSLSFCGQCWRSRRERPSCFRRV